MALSKSPSASVSAFLASIMPAPVASRSFLTSAAVIAMCVSLASSVVVRPGHVGGRRAAAARLGDGAASVSASRSRRQAPRLRSPRRVGAAASAASRRRRRRSAASAAAASASFFSSSSRSQSARGSSAPSSAPGCSSPVLAPPRAMRPSATASAMTRVSRPTERIASSLPGIGKSTSSGSQLVSRIAMIGMPSFLASSTARCSFLVSTIHDGGRACGPCRGCRRGCARASRTRGSCRGAPSSCGWSPRRRRSRSPRAPSCAGAAGASSGSW